MPALDSQVEERVIEKCLAGERLNLEDGILLFQTDLMVLGKVADEMRRRRHAQDRVTFVIDRNIYYTNVCVADCSFCAFFRRPRHEEAYTLSISQILEKVKELVELGGTQVLIQGGLNPELKLDYYLEMIQSIRSRFPQVHVHSFSPPEIEIIAKVTRLGFREVLRRFKEAGLNSMPGGGAEILVDRVRGIISPLKTSAATWIEIMRSAHEVGLKTTCTMVFGHVETIEERVIHLLRLRALQDETGGFRAFIPWSMSPQGTPGLSHLPMAGGEDYLRSLAVSRLLLDNVPSVQSGWVTEGQKLAQVALRFGANDMGGTVMEELVIEPTGVFHKTNALDLVRLIRRAGYLPVQRNTNYETVRIWN